MYVQNCLIYCGFPVTDRPIKKKVLGVFKVAESESDVRLGKFPRVSDINQAA